MRIAIPMALLQNSLCVCLCLQQLKKVCSNFFKYCTGTRQSGYRRWRTIATGFEPPPLRTHNLTTSKQPTKTCILDKLPKWQIRNMSSTQSRQERSEDSQSTLTSENSESTATGHKHSSAPKLESLLKYQGGTQETFHKDYFYAFELPFKYSNQEYIIVKIGATKNPGSRLYNFEHAFNKQTSNDEFKCLFGFKQNDDAVTTTAKAKRHPKFLFIVPFKSEDKGDSNTGEDCLRGLLGLPIINDFTREFKDSVPDPNLLEKQCGLTEWRVCRRKTAQRVRARFVSGDLSGNTEDAEGKYWDQWPSFVLRLRQILPNISTSSVEVTFQHKSGHVLSRNTLFEVYFSSRSKD